MTLNIKVTNNAIFFLSLVSDTNIYIYTLNPMEINHRDGPTGHKNKS